MFTISADHRPLCVFAGRRESLKSHGVGCTGTKVLTSSNRTTPGTYESGPLQCLG